MLLNFILLSKIVHIASQNAEDYSMLYPTPTKITSHCSPHHGIMDNGCNEIILQCIPQHGIILHDVSHNGGNYSAVYPKTWNIIPWCIPQHGILFCSVSHNVEYYSVVYPTMEEIILQCIPKRGILFRGVSHNM